MSSNLPATRDETPAEGSDDRMPLEPQRPLSVAFLPLALVTFILLALIIAAWTFLAAAT
ncbi:MAG: hypothetical protein ACRDG7_08070 [Candidatus Limnocylindria bacterium]